jgi:hypothetical protein
MKYIKKFSLFEDYQNGNLLCYHATGTKDENWKDIFTGGFRIGGGANYGPGIYSFYSLSDLLKDTDWSKSVSIIEAEITSLDGFIINNLDIAQKAFGEYNIRSQISNIMGEDWIKNNEGSIKEIEEGIRLPFAVLDKGRYERGDSLDIKASRTVLGRELKGWIFDEGPNRDTVWVITFDTSIIVPKRFTLDGGKTWETP